MRLPIMALPPRTRILLAITGQVILIAAYRLGFEWLFYPNLFWAAATLAYALSLRCPVCGRRQVFRGLSIFDIRMPSEKCHSCGNILYRKSAQETTRTAPKN